jgi:hypothetical protein
MLEMMGFRSKSSTVEAAPVSEGLLSIVRDRLQEEVFEKSKGKFLCTIDFWVLYSWHLANLRNSNSHCAIFVTHSFFFQPSA